MILIKTLKLTLITLMRVNTHAR